MPHQTIISRNQKKEIRDLKQEVSLLRSFIISMIGEDEEGNYRPEFIKEILDAAKEKPEFTFLDLQSFMAQLKRP